MPLKDPIARREYYHNWRKNNLELARTLEDNWRKANRKYFQDHYRTNREAYRAAFRRWHHANPAKAKAHSRRILDHQPPWAEIDLMNAFYDARPKDHEVDHIVPIKGITAEGYRISGLHVMANLQYLAQSENARKNNRMRPQDQTFCETKPPLA